MLGSTMVIISGVFILFGAVFEVLNLTANAYQSLVTFTVLPAIMGMGAVLTLIGVARFRKQGSPDDAGVVFDLRVPRQRNMLLFFLLTAPIVFIVLGLGAFEAYEFTESPEFCGMVCHQVMRPEHTQYEQGAHARVRCADCHIGPGAPWFVQSKLSGMRQLWGVAVGDYSRPISTPVHNLRPARDTCEQCHWPEMFHGKKLLVWKRIGEDGSVDDPIVSAVMLNIGGYNKRTQRNVGIHWHVSKDNIVEYQSDDSRKKIKNVRVHRADGTTDTFVKKNMPDLPKDSPWRTMDCVDCHNRPAHKFQIPEDALDDLILTGQIDGHIEGIRDVVLEAIKADYKSQEEAEAAIRKAMRGAFEEQAATRSDIDPEKSMEAAVKLYKDNVYPEMKIKWGQYPVQTGHKSSPGCFRCHDEKHENADGDVIGQDCETCHDVIVEEEAFSSLDKNTKAIVSDK
jgi:nitrate/TMAO reductase-like tetraheme cytochrome c subunit